MEIDLRYIEKFRRKQNININGLTVKSGGPRNEREEQIDRFVCRLNQGLDGRRPYTHARVAKMLQGIPTADLHATFQKCETYRRFGAGFHYELKPRV